MPSAKKHLRNARRHYDAAERSATDPVTRSWAAVELFYAAHQLVHAVLAGEDSLADEMRHPESHGSSDTYVGTNTLVGRLAPEIAFHYKSLFGAGKGVRYDGALIQDHEYRDLLNEDYVKVADWARERLTKQGRTLDDDWP